MIRDSFLTVCLDKKPTLPSTLHSTLAAAGITYGVPVFYAFPSENLNTVIDLQVPTDWGQGNPLTARFEISTTFTAAGATDIKYKFNLAVIAYDLNAYPVIEQDIASATTVAGAMENFPGISLLNDTNGRCLVQSRDLLITHLTKGTVIELPIPQQADSKSVKGRRFLSLGMYIANVKDNVAPTDFTAGGINAFVLPHSQGPTVHHTSGFAVAAGGV